MYNALNRNRINVKDQCNLSYKLSYV